MKEPINLLRKFLDKYELDGVCGYFITEPDDSLQVIIIFDSDWLYSQNTNPQFIVRRYKLGIVEAIKNYLNIEVNVGSIVQKCNDEGGLIEEGKDKKTWTEKVDQTFYDVLRNSLKKNYNDFKPFFEDIVENTIKNFISSNLDITDSKEIGELYRILKKPIRSHISKTYKNLLKNRYKLLYQG